MSFNPNKALSDSPFHITEKSLPLCSMPGFQHYQRKVQLLEERSRTAAKTICTCPGRRHNKTSAMRYSSTFPVLSTHRKCSFLACRISTDLGITFSLGELRQADLMREPSPVVTTSQEVCGYMQTCTRNHLLGPHASHVS